MSYIKSLVKLRWIPAMVVMAALASCAEPNGLQRVDHKVWRSSQPEKEQYVEMEQAGIKEVLNLRRYHSDDELAGHLKCHHVRMKRG